MHVRRRYASSARRYTHRKSGVRNSELSLTQRDLKELADLFATANAHGSNGLDMAMFRRAMRRLIDMEDEQLDMLFMKVDTNCNGLIDWDEFMSYYFLECVERDQMRGADLPFPSVARAYRTAHRDSVMRIITLPAYVGSNAVDPAYGRYITVGRDGTVAFWTTDMRHRYTRRVEPVHKKRSTVWVTDAVCIQRSHLLVLCTTSSDIQFYDISANRCKGLSRIIQLPGCPLAIDFYDYEDKEEVLKPEMTIRAFVSFCF